jgi:hypothetical protein
MTFDPYGKEYRAAKELKNCGFTPDSITAIQGTKIITRDGAQHVVPSSQVHLDESNGTHKELYDHGEKPMQPQTYISSSQHQSTDILVRVEEQQKFFTRYKNYTDQRLQKLEVALTQSQEIIKQLQSALMTIKSNQNAQSEREKQFQRGQDSKEPENKAIDRNNVAPSQVQVDKIFYCGTR